MQRSNRRIGPDQGRAAPSATAPVGAALLALLIASACQVTERSRQCTKLAVTVNATLDRVEETYRQAASKPIDWKRITTQYHGLSTHLRKHPPTDRRLGQAVSEYANVLSAVAGTTRALEVAVAKRQAKKRADSLRQLREQAAHHKRITLKIDRLCRK